MQRTLLKNIKECRKKLLPTGDLHRDHDLNLLKEHVGHVVNLLSDPYLPFEATDDLRTGVELVYKALLQEKVRVKLPQTCKKEKRPNLGEVDDEDYLSDWERDEDIDK